LPDLVRDIGIPQITEAVRAAIWAASEAEKLAARLKSSGTGEWDVPAPDQVSTTLPCTVTLFRTVDLTPEKPRGSLFGRYQLEVQYMRLLGDAEAKNTLVVSEATKVANVFAQGKMTELPGWTFTATTGVVPAKCFPARIELQDGFILGDDLAEIEQVTILITVEADAYELPVA
jgi:hypothetical protein